jgi:hypothetical protein
MRVEEAVDIEFFIIWPLHMIISTAFPSLWLHSVHLFLSVIHAL